MIVRSPVSILFGLWIVLPVLLCPALTSADVTVSVSPASLNRSGDFVTVTWSGVDSPSDLDWLGVYSPPNSSNDNFLGYKFLSSDSGWKSGSGSISIPLVKLRAGYSFRIFRWTEGEINPKKKDHDNNPLPGTAHLLARSVEVGFASQTPEQVHLAFTARNDEMRVMFVADDENHRGVRWGTDENENAWEYADTERVWRYEREDMCDYPANSSIGWRDPGWIHDAVMTGLESGHRYYYQVGSDAKGWTSTLSFISRNGESEETMAFLFGDMGTSVPYATFLRTQEESISTMKWILRDIEAIGDKPAFISHIGDISYARGYSWLWDHFFTQIEPVATKIPYHVCIGNHEYDWPLQPWKPEWSYGVYGKDGGGECGVPYSLKFNMPGNLSESTGSRAPATRNLYYSFNEGSVHFVYISTETNFLQGSSQYDFIKRDLESVNRSRTPFVVVQGHRPMYTTSNEVRDAAFRQRLQDHLEPLFIENNVTIALWGHVHRYERFCPLNNFTCGSTWKEHPIHIVIGMGGQDWQPVWQPRSDHPNDPIFPQPERSMYRGGEFGYTRLVATKEKLVFSYVGNHDGEVHDSVEIYASGQVVSGTNVTRNFTLNTSSVVVSPASSWYLQGAGILVLGVFLGYVLGLFSLVFKRDAGQSRWTPVKNDET